MRNLRVWRTLGLTVIGHGTLLKVMWQLEWEGSLGGDSVYFSRSVMSDSFRPHGLPARLPCPSPTPEVCSNSCPLSWWCHPTISSSVAPSPPAFNLSQHQGLSNEFALCIMWWKYWSSSFSISPFDESHFRISINKEREIKSIGEDVEKRERSLIVDGSINWYCPCGK